MNLKECFYDFFGKNTELFFLINGNLNKKPLIALSYVLNKIFSIKFCFVIYIALCVYFLCKSQRNKAYKNTKDFHNFLNFLVRSGTIYAIFVIFYSALKFLLKFPRPVCLLSGQVFTIMNQQSVNCFSSFPSAHTGISVLILAYAWKNINIFCRFIGVITVVCVAVSRIILAMHYPSDVLYGAILVILVIFFSEQILSLKIIKKKTAWLERSLRNIFA